MKCTHLISTVYILLLGITSALGQNNTITIPDVSVAKGKSISLPINMNNTADVVAVQFTLSVPEGLTFNTSSATLSERADEHSVTFQNIGGNKYMAMLFSSKNKAIKGRTGKLLSISLTASNSLDEGTQHQLTLSNVVIGAREGSNLTTSFNAGKVTISKSPDLEVSQVLANETVVIPDGKVNVKWSVANIGGLPTTGGWSELILLKNEQGTTKLLGTLHHKESVNAGGVVNGSAELNIPSIIGMDGNCRIAVKLIPNSDASEPSWLQENNIAETASSITVQKKLVMSPANANVDEINSKNVRIQLSRSGNTINDEVYSLARNADERIIFPESITIAKGQSSAYFYAQIVANEILDNDSIVTFTVSGNDYPDFLSTIKIEDDTYPSLNISTEDQEVAEGGNIKFNVTTQRASQNEIEVKMTCDLASHFNIPPNILIPAGQTSVEVFVDAVEDDVPNVEEVVTFTVTAARHNLASLYTVLVDNDVPALQLKIIPSAVSESAGPLAITAKLRRIDNIDKVVTVKFSDDSGGGIYYDRQIVTLEKGVEEATVNLGPIDNAVVDGERTYNISAAVWIASCSCNANNGTSGSVVPVPLTVYDDDGPTLTIISTVSILNEGGEMAVTVKRNTNTTVPLTVNLSSDHDADIEYPSTVTIPIGYASTSFVVKSKNNDTTGDGLTVTLNAKAAGYNFGYTWLMVSDQTLPDARIEAITAQKENYIHGDEMTFCIKIANKGNTSLPANTMVQLYKSGSQNAVANVYTPSVILVGETFEVNISTKADLPIGKHSYYAKVNAKKEKEELDYTNNSSLFSTIMIQPPFSTTTRVSKNIVAATEELEISGEVYGRNTANADVDVYVINMGYRHVVQTKTDDEGCFTVKYKPFDNQNGHFVVGSCFHGDKLDVEQCSFDIYAIDVKNSSLTCDVLKGESFAGKFTLTNKGVLPLTNVRVRQTSEQPNAEIAFSEAVNIAGGESVSVNYSITGLMTSPDLAWQTVKMLFTCDEGATATSDINFYIREPLAQIKSNVISIKTSIAIGSKREYRITLTNTGKAETGRITFATPSWIQLNSIQHVNSLTSGESVEVVLLIETNDQMNANVPIIGNIGINCENGNGISIPFIIEPVSSMTGILSVDVCDEFTYYTAESPHVSGANVVIKHPTTGAVITTGVTNEMGIFEAELPEGYYALTITADKHESYSNNVYVDPERTRNVIVNIGYSAITYNWIVEETAIEDEYKIKTKVTYETNVPVPCVVLGVPESIDGDNMRAGESTLVYFTATNKGLITALNTTIKMPENTDEWMFEALRNIEPFNLPSQQTVLIPVRITRLKDGTESRSKAIPVANNMIDNFSNCMAHVKATYEALCGDEMKNNESIERMAMKMCGMAATSATIYQYMSNFFGSGSGSGGLGSPAGGGTSTKTSRTEYFVVSEKSFNMCDTCEAKKAEDLFEVLISKTFLSSVNDGMNVAYDIAKNKGDHKLQKLVVTKTGLIALRKVLNNSYMYDFISGCWDIIRVIEISSRACPEPSKTDKTRAQVREAKRRSWQQEYDEAAVMEADYLENYYNILVEIFGDIIWLGTDIEDKLAFAVSIAENENFTDDEILAMCPASVTSEQALNLFKRLNGLDEHNAINNATLENLVNDNIEKNEAAVKEGYESISDKFLQAYNVCVEKYMEKSSSVCASITLQFSQKMVMTRQAFRGTLTVFNGNETTAMSDVKLMLEVKDENGNVATSHEFQINPETITGFQGQLNLEDSWILDAGQTGIATILFTPTKYAAPTIEKLYYFGGTLSYVDPFTGLTVIRNLSPVTLTVKPSPNLDLTYFMQRDIKGNDPITEEIEPSEEAEFSLLVNNVGYGDATDVKISTEQPQIIDKEKGLLIDFELLSSQLNGGEKTLALGGTVATDFGTIPANGTSYAQWWMKSSLLGHFTNYNVEATHVTSYGNPDLSLLNDVNIHELIRSIDIKDCNTKLVGFMTNDIADAEDTPDMLYLSNGEIENVSLAKNVEIQKLSNTDYSLKVSTGQTGWNYGNITDPTYGVSSLKSIVRQSNGEEMPLRNFWQTNRTLRDGKDPLYENRIHFADNISSSGETYILTFESTPELLLNVASIEGVLEERSVSIEPVNIIKVMFNKYIDPSTFTTDDISLAVQGIKQEVNSVVISTDDNKTFILDFSVLNEKVGNGYFILTINTSGIKDTEGYNGKNGKQASWIMFRDGLVALSTATSPISAGIVQKLPVPLKAKGLGEMQSDEDHAEYGSTIRLTTAPNEGYEFKNWTINGEVVSTKSNLEYVALGNMDIKANYTLKTYTVTISDSEEGGVVAGFASGVYSYGDVLNLIAKADEDYVFDGWIVNNQSYSSDNRLSIVVNESKKVNADFRRDIFQQSLTMSRGWNWISIYVNEPIPVGDIFGNITRVVGQFDEIIKDPIYGMIGGIETLLPGAAYKMNASYSAMKSFKGHLHNLSDRPIQLHTGWNWISYPYMEEKNINDVLANASEGDYLTSQFGFSEYVDGYWEGTLNNLTPGLGYIYKSSKDKTLMFDFSNNKSRAKALRSNYYNDDLFNDNVDVHKYPSTMNIIARITGLSDIDESKCLIYAFAGNECRGKSQYIGGNHYLTIYGDDATNITFVVENVNNGNTYIAKENVAFSQVIIGSRKAPYTIAFTETTDIHSLNDTSRKLKIYNPLGVLINSKATIESLKKLSRGIYIVNGKKFIVK
ncbi:MAG: CARDB domain-containing protein [Bacteroidaceae bacterium]